MGKRGSYVAIDYLERAVATHTENYEERLVYKHVTCSAYSGVYIRDRDYLKALLLVAAHCVLWYLTELTCVSFDTMLGTWTVVDKY